MKDAKPFKFIGTITPRRIEGTDFYAFDVRIYPDGHAGCHGGGVSTVLKEAFRMAFGYITDCKDGAEILKKLGWK